MPALFLSDDIYCQLFLCLRRRIKDSTEERQHTEVLLCMRMNHLSLTACPFVNRFKSKIVMFNTSVHYMATLHSDKISRLYLSFHLGKQQH